MTKCPSQLDEVNLFDPEVYEDPYPTYDLLREASPVWKLPTHNTYFLTSFEAVSFVLRNPALFGRGDGDDPPASVFVDAKVADKINKIFGERGWPRQMPLVAEPPVHRQYRNLIDGFFSVQGAASYQPMIRDITERLVDELEPRGSCELGKSFAEPLPVEVITNIMGFRIEDMPQLRKWSAAWVLPVRGGLTDEEQLYVAEQVVEFQQHIYQTMQEKKSNPDDSVVSYLVNEARLGGERPLTDGEIIGMVDHLYVGGNETTTFAITAAMWLMLAQPEFYADLAAHPDKVPQFVEEVLRLESPTQGLNRVALDDVEILGVPVPKGATVHMRFSAANRDPSIFECPADVSTERTNANRHLAFGLGETRCPGAGLTRLEQIIAVQELLAKLTNLRLTPGKNDFTHHQNFTLRSLKELWLTWDPTGLRST